MPWLIPCKHCYVKFSNGKGGLTAGRRCSISNKPCSTTSALNKPCYEMDTTDDTYLKYYPNVCYPKQKGADTNARQ